ncbi:hypothetical protein [Candidatus Poriferisodalis sp.]|uniref:hypothetical protein n=1 Tax=Candidatus Poriferisodalis sp. TaxID=3101277 RepID=UPI003B5C2053
MITRKIASEDRLVMSDPVAEQVQPFHSVLDIGTDATWVTLGWVVRERRCKGQTESRVPLQSPGTVPASANGRGYVFSGSDTSGTAGWVPSATSSMQAPVAP